jgi:hypothetical protein
MLEVHAQWNQGSALLRDLRMQVVDLILVKEELARSHRLVVGSIAV